MILLIVALFIPTGANALALGAGPLSKLLVPAPEPVRVQSIDALGGRLLMLVLEQVGKAIDEAVEAFWRVISKGRDKKTISPDDVAIKPHPPDEAQGQNSKKTISRCRRGGQEEEREDATGRCQEPEDSESDQEDAASVIPAGS